MAASLEEQEPHLVENGIIIAVNELSATPSTKKTYFNRKMRTSRELCLCALKLLCSERELPVRCLDAFAASGISGLQWKKCLSSSVQVTVNDKSPQSIDSIKQNCRRNGMDVTCPTISDDTTTFDDPVCQAEDIVEVTTKDASTLLSERQFDFVYLDPFGTAVQYLDVAFMNIMNGGIIVVTSTDLGALYGMTPHVARRNYGAVVQKVECFKEVAVRILIGAMVRSAAKANKGIDVLFACASETFISVAVRVLRGPKHADACVPKVQKVLYCRMCQDRVFIPDNTTPLVNPYKQLGCHCIDQQVGASAIQLGPMWCGSLFNTQFINRMYQSAEDLNLSSKVKALLKTLADESKCRMQSNTADTGIKNPRENVTKLNSYVCLKAGHTISKTCVQSPNGAVLNSGIPRDTPVTCLSAVNLPKTSCSENSAILNPASTTVTTSESQFDSVLGMSALAAGDVTVTTCDRQTGRKRKFEDICSSSEQDWGEEPPFYWNPQWRKMSGLKPPRSSRFVEILRQAGYRASLTHFDPCAARTNASLTQVKELLQEHCIAGRKS